MSIAIAQELRSKIEGEVRFDRYSRILYSTDASIYQIEPIGVVVPRNEGDVIEVLRLAAREHVPVLPRGGGTSLAVFMVDLDYFKRINDSFGHDAGDLVLKELGTLLKNQIRTSDVACRFGGEEFALVMPDASLEGARQKADAIRVAVSELDLRYNGKPVGRITASLGIALFPNHAADADALMRIADEALYHAKGAGRNRVVVGAAAAGKPPATS